MSAQKAVTIQRKVLEDIQRKLKELPENKPENKETLTPREAATLLRDTLLELRDKKGYSNQQLVDMLDKDGIKISLPTLRTILAKRKRGAGKTADEASTPAPKSQGKANEAKTAA